MESKEQAIKILDYLENTAYYIECGGRFSDESEATVLRKAAEMIRVRHEPLKKPGALEALAQWEDSEIFLIANLLISRMEEDELFTSAAVVQELLRRWKGEEEK